jgi:HlyD family secretion protein
VGVVNHPGLYVENWAKLKKNKKFLLKALVMEKLPSTIKSKNRWPLVAGIAAATLGLAGMGAYAFNSLRPSQVDLDKLTVMAQPEDITLKITANGIVLPGQTVNLSPKNSGRVAQIFVEQGDLVKQGQKIAQMENSDGRVQLLQAQATLRQAQANLAKGQNGSRPEEIFQAQARLESAQASLDRSRNGNRPQEIAQVQAKLTQVKAALALTRSIAPQQIQQANAQVAAVAARLRLAALKLDRTGKLNKEGAIALEKLEEARAEFQTANANYLEAQQRLQQVRNNATQEIAQRQATVAELEQSLQQQQLGSRKEDTAKAAADVRLAQSTLQQAKNGTRKEEIAQLVAAVDIARTQVLAAQVQLRESIIFAPFDGIITQRYASIGAFVTPTTTASKEGQATSTSVVAIAKDLEVKAKVPEVDIGKITNGQKVDISADAYPDEKFQGSVRIVAPEAVVEQNVTAFEVRLSIDGDQRGALKSGMNVNTSFVGKQVANSLMVPTVAIVRNKGKDGVLVPGKDKQPEFKEVGLGFTYRDKTQVTEGIKAGDRVFIDTPKGFKLNKEKEK